MSDSFDDYDKARAPGHPVETNTYMSNQSAMGSLQAELDSQVSESERQLSIEELRNEYDKKLARVQAELDRERHGPMPKAEPPKCDPPKVQGYPSNTKEYYPATSAADINWWILITSILTLLLVIYLVFPKELDNLISPTPTEDAVIQPVNPKTPPGTAQVKKLEGANRWLRHLNKKEREKSAILQQHNEIFTERIKKMHGEQEIVMFEDPGCDIK